MGFGYPAALGAKVAFPDQQVIDIDGDGSFLMNVQELATAHIEKIAAKAMILNNQHLGMVMQWEDNFYQGNRGHTYLGDPGRRGQIYPDYVAMARSFNVPSERVMYKKDLRPAIQRMLDSDQPFVLDVVLSLHRARHPVHPRQRHGGGHGLLNEPRGPHLQRPPPAPSWAGRCFWRREPKSSLISANSRTSGSRRGSSAWFRDRASRAIGRSWMKRCPGSWPPS